MSSNEKDLPSYDDLMEIFRKIVKTAWNIGDKIHQPEIDKWLNNFTGEALCPDYSNKSEAEINEKQLALFLLCNYVFYNENEIKHLTRVMFNKYLHFVFDSENKKEIDDGNINDLLDKTQFVPLGTTGESSSYLLYRFRQENNLGNNNFRRFPNTENIVFIDDFTISGTQVIGYFSDYLSDHLQENPCSAKKYFMLFMAVTNEAILEFKKEVRELEKKGVSVTMLPCIIIDERSRPFSKKSIIFEGYKDKYLIQAEKMCSYYGEKLVDVDNDMTSLGYKGSGYMFGSYYNTPDNTLPIFWSNKNNWYYIFKRYNKNYSGRITFGGRYV